MKICLLFVVATIGLFAQMKDNRDKKLTCDNKWNNAQPRSCKVAEQTLPVLGSLSVDAGHNGGVSVLGWSQNQTLVRSKIEAWAPTESEASLIAGQVHVETSSGMLRATGPDATQNNRGWAVSWEVFAPHNTDLKLSSHNGGVSVSDVRGRMELKTHNGGLNLVRVAGELSGATHNGGVHVVLAGNAPSTSKIKLETHNGGIVLAMPSSYSARVHSETNNGGIRSDFALPESRDRNRRQRTVDFTIGSGGPAIDLKSNNGGVQIQKI